MDALVDPIDSTPIPTPVEDQQDKPAKAIRVFSYACKIAYPEEAAHVEHQLTLTHRHRNLLTEIILKGREKYRDHPGTSGPGYQGVWGQSRRDYHRNQSGPPGDLRLEKTKQDN
jgi:hypothetical protein